MNSAAAASIDPRVLKQLLLAQWTAGANPLDSDASSISSAGDSGDNLFSQMLSQLLNPTFSATTSLYDMSTDSSSYSGLGSLGGLSALTGSGNTGLSAPGSLSAWSALQPYASGLSSDGHASTSAYDDLIVAAASRYGIDPALIKGVVQTESGFRPDAGSSAGAKGLMQLMDGTARGLGVSDVYDPQQNIDGGSRYLSYLMRKYDGNEMTALAAYNAGPGRVDRLGLYTNEDVAARLSELPEETQGYIRKVLSARSHWAASL
ncbi:lytic transglycosylase domain-containing protein [Cohnella nanjingensis]|uniref:Lytic transglycosylase domain-containing protein n=2 Tax=Cohnella nanjingensis TaxID=1387779 RepID=A0A7X0VK05_9BACL|nr:lytic transglycosylase domain-containing protein [Cohnella nanjingensis]